MGYYSRQDTRDIIPSPVNCVAIYLGKKYSLKIKEYVAFSKFVGEELIYGKLLSRKLKGRKPCNTAALTEIERVRAHSPRYSLFQVYALLLYRIEHHINANYSSKLYISPQCCA